MEEKAELKLVNSLQIASPCPITWESMSLTNDDAVRFCGQCHKNVYDFSLLSSSQASLLLQQASCQEQSLCVQLYRRADGRVITGDCPAALKKIRAFGNALSRLTAGLLTMFVTSFNSALAQKNEEVRPAGQTNKPECTQLRRPQAPLGGAVAPVNWEAMACSHIEIREKVEQLKELEKSRSENSRARAKLHLEIADNAQKKNVPIYAMQHLAQAESLARELNDKGLLRKIWQSQLTTLTTLKMNTRAIEEKLEGQNK
jgi:hypothetical protein